MGVAKYLTYFLAVLIFSGIYAFVYFIHKRFVAEVNFNSFFFKKEEKSSM